jgi:putative flippase GtrA
VGLVVKYVLDKRWIFYDETRAARARRDGSSSSIR